jgi:RNA polymerase sigma-70 factor (ECF subfamily)
MARFLHQSTVSDLVRSAQQGQKEAFDLLFEQFYEPVYRFVITRLQNHLDAEDITQEVFVRAWLNISKFVDQGIPFSHYLFRVAHNAIVDFHRRNKRLVFVEDLDFNSNEEEIDEAINLRMDMHNLNIFLSRLPPDYQKVLILRFLTGLTPHETACLMKRSEVATRILQHRALHAVRELVGKDIQDKA